MLEHLRQVVGLRGYAQRDPLNEYKSEAFELFENLITNLREAVTAQLMRVEVVQGPPPDEQSQLPYMEAHKIDPIDRRRRNGDGRGDARIRRAARRAGSAQGQRSHDLGQGRPQRGCPCGSGKKYKHCHGKYA